MAGQVKVDSTGVFELPQYQDLVRETPRWLQKKRADAQVKRLAEEEERTRPEREAAAKGKEADMAERSALSKLKLAKFHIERGERDEARDALQTILKTYPQTKVAVEAKAMLEKLPK